MSSVRVDRLIQRNALLSGVVQDLELSNSLRPGRYDESLRPVVTQTVLTVPMQPTRIDIELTPSEEMERVDFFIPEEPEIWAAWAVARVKREACDAQLSGFSECVTLEGSSANIKLVSHKTRRVFENQNRLFFFAIDHGIDSAPRERAPLQVDVDYHPGPDAIRAASAHARRAGVHQPMVDVQTARKTNIPWLYVSGLMSAVALLYVAKLLHLT